MISYSGSLRRVDQQLVDEALQRARGGSSAAAIGSRRRPRSGSAIQNADHPIGDAGSSPAPRSKWRTFRFPPADLITRLRLAWQIVRARPVQLKLTWSYVVRYQLPLKSEAPVTLPANTIVDIRFEEGQ